MIYNPGGFRGNWVPGNITKRTLYDMFPFDTELYKANISGLKLKEAMNIIQKERGVILKKNGYYPTDGLIFFTKKL